MDTYRIKEEQIIVAPTNDGYSDDVVYETTAYLVQVKCFFWWTTVKTFIDWYDQDYAKLLAEELLEKLNE